MCELQLAHAGTTLRMPIVPAHLGPGWQEIAKPVRRNEFLLATVYLSSPTLPHITTALSLLNLTASPASPTMNSDMADQKLKELHIEELTVKTGGDARATAQYAIDPAREKALLRKLDLRVVPILWFLFMLAFLDRTNIGMMIPIMCGYIFRSSTNVTYHGL